MKNNKIYIPIFLAIAIVIGVFIGSNLNYPNKMAFLRTNSQELKIKRLINYIEYDYVDKINTDSLLDGTIKNIVSKLDPHSVYIPAKDHESISEKMNGEFVGIGIQFRIINDSLTIINTIKGGPSETVGLKAGDRILIADKDTLSGKKITTKIVLKKLKGVKRSIVDLLVYRKSTDEILDFTVMRKKIPINSIDAAYLVKDDVGYIKLHSFTATAYNDFHRELIKLKLSGMHKLIFDLRGNTGGFIGVTTQIIDEFLEGGKLIVFTKNNKGLIEKTLATTNGDFEDGKVYVLIDEESASASEIVSGALQDNDKATIIGRRSFGKGLVQQEMELGDGSFVRLTTARYYTPTGRSIQKPYRLNHKKEYYLDNFQKRYLRGELTSADSIKVVDSLKFTTPKGKIVYGGGGIIPDVFVPIDTTNILGNYYLTTMNNFVFEYVDNHRKDFENMSITYFMDNFDNDNAIYKTYLKHIQGSFHFKKIDNNAEIKHYLKAMFARELYDNYGFYQVLNTEDKMIQKVLELEGY